MRFVVIGAAATAVAIISLQLSPAWAQLGGSFRPIKKNMARPLVSPKGYTVHESSCDARVLREYVAPSGIVFAVAWSGLTHPDNVELLGKYADQYRQALDQAPPGPGRRPVRVAAAQVVVEKWGHMRNLQGRAYLPSLFPPGVTADAIR